MVCSILAALHYSPFPLAAMPGPYHIAVARPIYLRASGDGSWLYQEILMGLSENYQDSHQVATFRWFIVRADLPYPMWFQAMEKTWEPLNGGAYSTVPASFMSAPYQVFYVFENFDSLADIYVHTPGDQAGVYSVFQTTLHPRDSAFYSNMSNMRFVGHRVWPGEDNLLVMRANMLAMPPKSRM